MGRSFAYRMSGGEPVKRPAPSFESSGRRSGGACGRHEDTSELFEDFSSDDGRSDSSDRVHSAPSRSAEWLLGESAGKQEVFAKWDSSTLKLTSSLCEDAASLGDLAGLRHYRSIGVPWGNTSQAASRNGHLECLQWAHAEGAPWDCRTCIAAAAGGHLSTLQWARANGCPWNERVCQFAAEGGHRGVLKWAREEGCPWDAFTCSSIAAKGDLDLLQWAREKGCPWSERTCELAAAGGHLHVLKWARGEGCPWNIDTPAAAARGGHLHVLEWAVESGCPWAESTWWAAARCRHNSCLEYARNNGCPGGVEGRLASVMEQDD